MENISEKSNVEIKKSPIPILMGVFSLLGLAVLDELDYVDIGKPGDEVNLDDTVVWLFNASLISSGVGLASSLAIDNYRNKTNLV